MTNLNDKEIRKLVKALAKKAYPDYNGRLFRFCERKTYFTQNYWSEGSRYYFVAVDLKTGEITQPNSSTQTPWSNTANSTFAIPQGVGILQHSIILGNDRGITLYVAPKPAIEANEVRQLNGQL